MTPTEIVPAAFARHVLLSLQALPTAANRRPASGAGAVTALVERLGYVQVDSINVVDRAHHLILSARLDDFRPAHLAEAVERRRELFEHWTHDACVIPVQWYPHWRHRFALYAKRAASRAWWRERLGNDPDRLLRRVLARVRREGPLRARDFIEVDGGDGAAARRGGGAWWNWRPEKAALEHLWRSGRLAIAGRDGFEKIYDLAERVHPEWHAARPPGRREYLEWLCRSAVERLGFATEREIAGFWGALAPADVRAWVRREVSRGALVRVSVEPEGGGAPVSCVAPAAWRDSFPALVEAPGDSPMVALAPFDPVIRDRARTLRLFGFDYRFEAFTPAPKRRYGYYVMPLLEGDRLVGRIDPRFDRDAGVLEIRGPWWEPGVRSDRARTARLEAAMEGLAKRIGAASWTFTR